MGRIDNIRRIFKNQAKRGLFNSLKHIVGKPHHFLTEVINLLYDLRFGIDTGGIVSAIDLKVKNVSGKFTRRYEGTSIIVFKRMIRKLEIIYKDFVFVDIGSGKGRCLFAASMFGFKEIIGIEHSPEMHKVAESNRSLFFRHKKYGESVTAGIKLLNIDALDWAIPRDNYVIYLCNPFSEEIMVPFLAKIDSFLKENGKDAIVYIVYYNPKLDHLFHDSRLTRLVSNNQLHFLINPLQLKYSVYSNISS